MEIIAFTRTVDPAMTGGDGACRPIDPIWDSGFSLDMLGGLPIDNLKLGNVVARLQGRPKLSGLAASGLASARRYLSDSPLAAAEPGSVTDESGNSQPEFAGLVKLYRNPHSLMDADLLLRRFQ